jgi:translocation and assembly module TamB
VPIDLALDTDGRSRLVDRPMDVRVVADSLDAAVALSYLDALEDVAGVVSGDFRIGGTLESPEPSGVLRLLDGAWSIEVLGVRHSEVEGMLTLNADRTVDVQVTSRAAGTSTVRGQVTLEPLSDPRLDLTASFRNFQAVGRRDVEGAVSGEVHLGDTYGRPLLTGSLSVDHGTLFLEEFARSAEVVDLSDPRFGLLVDTAALSGRPLLVGLSNPFLQNLRVNVDLSVPRNAWLRSEAMNVEMGGELIVSYDRSERDVVLVGDLQALRGSYSVLSRRFDVEGGTVGFIGTSGINPALDIEAVARVRRQEGGPLDVNATVSGTLTQPRVRLSTEEQGVAQSDLVSYLIFGRPSSQLVTQGGAGDVATEAFVDFATGAVASRLGTALSQQWGLDYLNISQVSQYGLVSGAVDRSFLAGTQFELGQYLGEDVFVVLIFRTPSEEVGSSTGVFGGARVEVAMTDDYNFQAFWEDPRLRSNLGALGQLDPSKILGVFIFREWGY